MCGIVGLVKVCINCNCRLQKYHKIPECSLLVTPKICISIVFSFSLGHFNSQEKLNFGGLQIKSIMVCYGIFWSGQYQISSGFTTAILHCLPKQ